MTWPQFLKYAQGVIMIETLAYDRVPLPPFADQAGIMRFQQSISQRLKDLWNMMFPHTKAYEEDLRKKAMAFKARLKQWRQKR